MGAKYTDAQRRAIQKYQSKFIRTALPLTEEQHARFYQLAEAKGTSLKSLIVDLLEAEYSKVVLKDSNNSNDSNECNADENATAKNSLGNDASAKDLSKACETREYRASINGAPNIKAEIVGADNEANADTTDNIKSGVSKIANKNADVDTDGIAAGKNADADAKSDESTVDNTEVDEAADSEAVQIKQEEPKYISLTENQIGALAYVRNLFNEFLSYTDFLWEWNWKSEGILNSFDQPGRRGAMNRKLAEAGFSCIPGIEIDPDEVPENNANFTAAERMEAHDEYLDIMMCLKRNINKYFTKVDQLCGTNFGLNV